MAKEISFLKTGGTVTDISEKLQGIVDGAFDYIMANCPQKPAYLQVGMRKYGDKYELTAYLGAGWYFAYPEKEKAYKWLEDLGKQVKAKYPQIEKFGMAGYGNSNVESKAHIDKEALSKQMNNPAYLREKGLMKTGGTTKKLSEKQLWALIDNANWSSDNNYERIGKTYAKLSNEDYVQFKMFTSKLDKDLNDKFEKAWLNKDGKGGFDVSDDGWSDLRAEVIGSGESFYKSITAEKLREMAKRNEYTENFLYSLQSHKKFNEMLRDKESQYCGGGKMKTGGTTSTDRHNKMQKIKAFMDQFPNNATTWDKATDELATLNNSIGDFIDNYKGGTFKTFGGELPNDTRLTPAKRNTNHKKIILKYLPKLSDRDFNTFYENFADWFENKFKIGGSIKDFFAGTTVKTKNGEYWKPFVYEIGGL